VGSSEAVGSGDLNWGTVVSERLTISTTIDERGRRVVAVAGEVDLATAPQLAECLLELTDRDVAVDLSSVTFFGSSGMAVLVQANQAFTDAGHTLHTFGEQEMVRRVLEIAGLYEVFRDGEPPGAH
jgi:anti-sigma B factor antagonist